MKVLNWWRSCTYASLTGGTVASRGQDLCSAVRQQIHAVKARDADQALLKSGLGRGKVRL